MTEGSPQTGREHEVGTFTASLLTFDLDREIEQLRSEGRWQSGHTAKTLAKYSDFRVVLIVMKTGGRLEKHRTEGRISFNSRRTNPVQYAERSSAWLADAPEHDIPICGALQRDAAFGSREDVKTSNVAITSNGTRKQVEFAASL